MCINIENDLINIYSFKFQEPGSGHTHHSSLHSADHRLDLKAGCDSSLQRYEILPGSFRHISEHNPRERYGEGSLLTLWDGFGQHN